MKYGSDGDRIAQEAALLLLTKRAEDVPRAVQLAMERMGLRGSRSPSVSMVRQHVNAMLLQAQGGDAEANIHHTALQVAEDVMTVVEERIRPLEVMLVGRLAAGRSMLDAADPEIHLRVYARVSVGEIVASLVEHGFEEPVFETAHTRLGRLERIRFSESGVKVTLTHCPPEMLTSAEQDLHTGQPIKRVNLQGVRGIPQYTRVIPTDQMS